MEIELNDRGYVCEERAKFDTECKKDSSETKWANPPRFTYQNGSFRVLTESRDRPYWTVHKMVGSHLMWFVDFPTDVNVHAVFSFIAAS